MDSGTNSASLQSSSTGGGVGVGGAGDEEYDSRAGNSDSFSSAFHTQNSSSSSMFDPFANYFNPIYRPQLPPPPSQNYTTTANSIFNLDTNWSNKRIRSDQINNNPMLLSSSSDNSSHYLNNSLSFGTTTAGVSFPSSSEEHRAAAAGGNVSVTTTISEPAAAAVVDQSITQPARNPKKRSRASRRAPTTVLTTDTTNFRAMVQEFTGIPAPPFTSSYFPQRTRFDLFASAENSGMRSVVAPAAAANNNPFNISQSPSNYLRRPFPQKIQPPPPFISPSSGSSSSSSSLMLNRLPNNIASVSGSSMTTSASNSTINYQLPSGVVNSVTQGSNLFSTIQQNSMLTSLLQSSQKYPIGLKEQQQFQMPSNSTSQFQMPSSMNNNIQHGHLLSELPNLISPEQATAAAASSRNDNSINAAANFHGDKVQESRGGEGMVESWICSSD